MKIGQKGFSLLEALIVIGLLAVVLAIVMPNFYRVLQAYRVQTAATRLAINIRFARNAAVKQKANYRIVIRNETHSTSPNTYYFEVDPERDGSYVTYTRLDPDVPDGILIKTGSVAQLDFDSRGRSTPAGFIRMVGLDGSIYVVTVTLNGGVSAEKV